VLITPQGFLAKEATIQSFNITDKGLLARDVVSKEQDVVYKADRVYYEWDSEDILNFYNMQWIVIRNQKIILYSKEVQFNTKTKTLQSQQKVRIAGEEWKGNAQSCVWGMDQSIITVNHVMLNQGEWHLKADSMIIDIDTEIIKFLKQTKVNF